MRSQFWNDGYRDAMRNTNSPPNIPVYSYEYQDGQAAARRDMAETAQRKANDRLKARAEQRPLDIGLFSDESKQTDLIDSIRRVTR